ncbi:hypothetical protein HPULCUR_002815 [Helicostylum pulchrum]|uniref:Uncharacterized protein n=1 Tax=Helicostylum pulchrum TaxID=562976 RepID=A0ABP9XRN9_9FUNG
MLAAAYSSDRKKERTFHAIAGASVCLVGYIVLSVFIERAVLYTGVCIAVAGLFVLFPILNAWLTGNIALNMKKSIVTAMAVSANNSVGLLGSNIYRQSDAPRYLRGHRVNLMCISLFIVLALLQRSLLRKANDAKKLEKSKLTIEELSGFAAKDARIGDESLDFMCRV